MVKMVYCRKCGYLMKEYSKEGDWMTVCELCGETVENGVLTKEGVIPKRKIILHIEIDEEDLDLEEQYHYNMDYIDFELNEAMSNKIRTLNECDGDWFNYITMGSEK